jgi:hypothetical protein
MPITDAIEMRAERMPQTRSSESRNCLPAKWRMPHILRRETRGKEAPKKELTKKVRNLTSELEEHGSNYALENNGQAEQMYLFY